MSSKENHYQKTSAVALLPLLVFVALFLGSGIVTGSFYTLPAPIAVLGGLLVAFLLFHRNGMEQNMNNFIKGCGNSAILTMCFIILLAGAFAQITQELGATTAIAQLTQQYLSVRFLYAGVFVMASFMSFSSGTSVGTITTLLPIVAGFLQIENISQSLVLASLLGGAMFGDNLSFISDTTIAATQSQGCQMKDKFRVNVRIAFPASLVTIVVLVFVGMNLHASSQGFSAENTPIEWLKMIPYIVVIALASWGTNVFVTLFVGILVAGSIGVSQSMSVLEVSQHIYTGFSSMNSIFLVFLLMGGLSYMIEKQGGISFILRKMNRFMTTPLRAKAGVAGLVTLTDLAIANNTIAIVVSAPVAKEVSHRFGIKSSYMASILDISSCIVQGIVPYGAQVLLLLANDTIRGKVGYFDLISQSYYIWFLLLFSVVFFLRKAKR